MISGTALSLRIIQMSVPRVIRSGDDGNLMCLYDLEGEHLYSTRWYRYRREFYRYTPKENPAKKTFPIPGINVEKILISAQFFLIAGNCAVIRGENAQVPIMYILFL
uniref:Ig-like domain-containing protein n=1 Tax=Phlebotomus papatasi TaxID=29031 RepID=A0A1B0D3M5_PHLPP